MQLDRNFVKTLSPPLSSMLQHGHITAIAEELEKTPLTIRNAIHGASTNEKAVEEALRIILQLDGDIEQFLKQLPPELIERLRKPCPTPA
jgi:predicted transcriptional regulator